MKKYAAIPILALSIVCLSACAPTQIVASTPAAPDRVIPGSMATGTGGAAAMNGIKEDGAGPGVTGTKETGHKQPGAGNRTMDTGGNLLNR